MQIGLVAVVAMCHHPPEDALWRNYNRGRPEVPPLRSTPLVAPTVRGGGQGGQACTEGRAHGNQAWAYAKFLLQYLDMKFQEP
jgi:hypothetical protein